MTLEQDINRKLGAILELIQSGVLEPDLSDYGPIVEISESAYNSLQNKDYDTIYLITE